MSVLTFRAHVAVWLWPCAGSQGADPVADIAGAAAGGRSAGLRSGRRPERTRGRGRGAAALPLGRRLGPTSAAAGWPVGPLPQPLELHLGRPAVAAAGRGSAGRRRLLGGSCSRPAAGPAAGAAAALLQPAAAVGLASGGDCRALLAGVGPAVAGQSALQPRLLGAGPLQRGAGQLGSPGSLGGRHDGASWAAPAADTGQRSAWPTDWSCRFVSVAFFATCQIYCDENMIYLCLNWFVKIQVEPACDEDDLWDSAMERRTTPSPFPRPITVTRATRHHLNERRVIREGVGGSAPAYLFLRWRSGHSLPVLLLVLDRNASRNTLSPKKHAFITARCGPLMKLLTGAFQWRIYRRGRGSWTSWTEGALIRWMHFLHKMASFLAESAVIQETGTILPW